MISEYEEEIIFADTDAMGIVYHGRYLEFMERGRLKYLEKLGYPYERFEKEGIWMPVSAISCKYKTPARVHDKIIVRTILRKLKGASFEMGYQMINKKTGDICFEGTSTHPITDTSLKPIKFKKVKPELYQLSIDNMEGEFEK